MGKIARPFHNDVEYNFVFPSIADTSWCRSKIDKSFAGKYCKPKALIIENRRRKERKNSKKSRNFL